MNGLNTKVLGLGAIAVMLLMLLAQQGADREPGESGKLLPGLDVQLESVTRVEIVPADSGATMTAEHRDGVWIVLEKSGHPADFKSLSELLTSLADLGIAERKTSRTENHARLGVAADGEGAGTLVRVTGSDTFEVIVGKASEARGSFVRLAQEDQVYLTSAEVEIPDSAMSLIDPVVINIDSAEVMGVEISSQGSILKASRDTESGDMVIENLPEGAELKYETIVDSLARTLINLRMTDVATHDPARFDGASVTRVNTASTEDIEVLSVKSGDAYWVHLSEKPQWQYQVSEYSYNLLNKKLEDMIKSGDAGVAD